MPEVFPIAPASAKPLWFLGVVSVVLLAVVLMLAYTAWSSRHARVEVHATELVLVGDLWGRRIPLSSLVVDQARVVDLRRDPELAPRWRTLGTGLPGYASGWFKLRNGEKGLAYLTRRDRVLYLPTRERYALLLSAEEPEALLERIRSGIP